jgi:hypothetical protein
MIKKEMYETLNDDLFSISINQIEGCMVIEPQSTILLEKEEVSDLIQILKDLYERMD